MTYGGVNTHVEHVLSGGALQAAMASWLQNHVLVL